ncbi:MAG: S9 family peptidase [Nitrolancea sp.]
MTNPLSPQTLVYGFKSAGDPQISPSGDRIVYTLSKADPETAKVTSNLWICNVDGGDARQLTWTGERNGGGRWSPDGTSIAFVSDRAGKGGVFLLDAAQPGDARELTHHGQPVHDLAWSPDGSSIAYSTTFDPENPDETEPDADAPAPVRVTRRIDYKQDGRGYLNDKRTHVFVVDVASGERRRVTKEAVDHYFPQWSPDGKTISVDIPNRNGMCSQLGLVSVDSGDMKLVGPEQGTVGAWSWSPSGDRIIIAGDTQQTHQLDFFVYDVNSGEVKRLTDDLPSLPVGGAPGSSSPSQPVWLDDRQVLFHAMRAGASGLNVIDAESGTVEPILGWRAVLSGLSTDDAHHYVVQGYSSLDAPGEISVIDTNDNSARIITNYSKETLAQSPAAKWERFDVERGGLTIEAWLLKPVDFDPNKRYPAVLDIHGGPNGHYGYGFDPVHQLLSTNGFVVVYSNPRGSSSYGRDFTMRVTEDWGGEDYRDLMAVMDKAEELPYVDSSRTGVSGYSYGGYMTSWIIGQTNRFQACCCGAPCFDLESMYGTSDISHTFGEQQWGGAPHVSKEWYAAHSPSTFAHRATTPTLIIHGEADDRCPIGQGEQMFVALKKAGCEVEFARYPGGSHGFRRAGNPAHRVDVLTRMLGWFKDHLGEPA